MRYEMEELAAVVGGLAEKENGYESTSISYEKAEQLMGAVLYCMEELERAEPFALMAGGGMTAQRAYEAGAVYVREKTEKALELYHAILSEFQHYGNECLYDTFAGGLPEFFTWYDIRFEPQNTILTLDYPVLKDLSAYTGIDKIYEFLKCIALEQKFMQMFPDQYAEDIVLKYKRKWQGSVENVCEVVLLHMAGHILAGKTLAEFELEEAELGRIREVFAQTDAADIEERIRAAIEVFSERNGEQSDEISEYFSGAVSGIVKRLKNAADHGRLGSLL
ncbi:MAG: hypothetical protein K2P64_02180 [Lachnospiraceae bacterium]|nr:hypothetical protein [Lachnospiraceae bacterium]